jgi:hypothetical protein
MLLDGVYDIESLDTTDSVKEILYRCKRVAEPGTISDHFSPDDLRQLYSKWNESTSTSPSGLHLGHEKAILKMQAESEDSDEIPLSETIFRIKATFLNLAIQHGHVYKRWRKIINATIEKIPGKPLLHKLRVIHLIESDFNAMIGIL